MRESFQWSDSHGLISEFSFSFLKMGKTNCEIKIYLLNGCRGAPKSSPTTGGKLSNKIKLIAFF
jgi:hypothetical protein